jgi:phosphopantothenoylcysteine decarboxylase/phosphopantothenate--cysteine ligase
VSSDVGLEIKGTWGDELAGKRIAHCITGSVSVYKAPDIARSLVRHGADVFPVMSPDAARLLSPKIMEWATGQKPLTVIGGRTEHIEFTEGKDRVDLVLVAPASANTIAKVSHGVSDTSVTLVVSAALGAGIPVVLCPVMHGSMMSNPAVEEALSRLRGMGVSIVEPLLEEQKAKIPPPEWILDEVIYRLAPKPLAGRRFVVSAGPTREHIDSVRFITNASSGRMGIELTRALRMMGGDVSLVLGPTSLEAPRGVKVSRVTTAAEMLEKVLEESEGAEAFFSTAAVSDYRPSSGMVGKLESAVHTRLSLELVATPKVINEVKEKIPTLEIIPFKAVYGLNHDPRKIYAEYEGIKPIMLVVNDVSRPDIGFASDYNEVTVISRSGRVTHIPKTRKTVVARKIVELYIEEKLRPSQAHSAA